jgi:hypothetical protein
MILYNGPDNGKKGLLKQKPATGIPPTTPPAPVAPVGTPKPAVSPEQVAKNKIDLANMIDARGGPVSPEEAKISGTNFYYYTDRDGIKKPIRLRQ